MAELKRIGVDTMGLKTKADLIDARDGWLGDDEFVPLTEDDDAHCGAASYFAKAMVKDD